MGKSALAHSAKTAPAVITESKVLTALEAASRDLAACRSPADYIGNYDDVEKLRLLADKAKLDRDILNRIGDHQVTVVRQAGSISKDIERNEGGRPPGNPHHDDAGFSPPTAKQLGYSNRVHRERWELIARLPDNKWADHREKILKAPDKTITIAGVLAAAKKWQREMERANRAANAGGILAGCTLFNCDLNDAPIEPNSVDWIITDPPYPEEFIGLYADLARLASVWLRPGGSLLAMAGEHHLPAVMAALTSADLIYQWTLAYLTPGGQAVQIFPRKVNTFWKPVFWFVKGEYHGRWIGDVVTSKVNDNDKRFHDWGQSESGFADLINRFTEPGHVICDPFMGGGTTGAVALAMAR